MAAFAEYQPRYAEHGIITLPSDLSPAFPVVCPPG